MEYKYWVNSNFDSYSIVCEFFFDVIQKNGMDVKLMVV